MTHERLNLAQVGSALVEKERGGCMRQPAELERLTFRTALVLERCSYRNLGRMIWIYVVKPSVRVPNVSLKI
jgi:hypothetical protein